MPGNLPFAYGSEASRLQADRMLTREAVDAPVASVVSVVRVFGARIAEADDEPAFGVHGAIVEGLRVLGLRVEGEGR